VVDIPPPQTSHEDRTLPISPASEKLDEIHMENIQKLKAMTKREVQEELEML
jgi:hypothetical protein